MSEVKSWMRRGTLVRHLFRYRQAELRVGSLYVVRPVFVGWLLRLLSHGNCRLTDNTGKSRAVSLADLLRYTGQYGRDLARRPATLRRITQEVESLLAEAKHSTKRPPLNLNATPVYLRTDLAFDIQSGGSIGHIAGVANNLDKFCGRPILLTTDTIPTVRDDIETHLIRPTTAFGNLKQMPGLVFTEPFARRAAEIMELHPIAFLYQRYGLDNYSGVKLARQFCVPFVLEYNGSDIWINRNWGSGLQYEALSTQIEMLNLHAADLIVVVSEPMRAELVERGIEAAKILVNPNGVEPERYAPTIDGSAVREKYGLDGKTIIGFIGTFGPWHGAEKLAEAFGLLLRDFPDLRQSVRLLLIGDGVKRAEVEAALRKFNVNDAAILTGLVPQREGPNYLAACDILASPHVPNADGTPFFGSPTKLFEYMAMGKAIIASDLDQIGDVLEHHRTAYLVCPGDTEDLKNGLKALLDNPTLRERLGAAARAEALAKYTWEAHTGRIIAALQERCA